ncbi:hypothetical protein Hanom_Chr10g00949741 [Helianthus anomalus]
MNQLRRQEELSLEAASLFLQDRGKVVYILPFSDPTLALLLVGFTEYDDDDDDDDEQYESIKKTRRIITLPSTTNERTLHCSITFSKYIQNI